MGLLPGLRGGASRRGRRRDDMVQPSMPLRRHATLLMVQAAQMGLAVQLEQVVQAVQVVLMVQVEQPVQLVQVELVV